MLPSRATTVGSLAVALGLALAASSCDVELTEEAYVETSEAELAWVAGTRLEVVNVRGDLEIVERPGERVSIEARKRVIAASDDEERELAREIRVEAVQADGKLRIEVTYPDRALSSSRVVILGREARRPRASVQLRVSLPAGAPIRMETRSGDLRSERYTGTLDFSSSSGDLYLDDWRGDCLVTTRSGDASILRIDGSLRMSSASGDLSGEEVTQDLDFTATSGDIQLARVGGHLAVSTASGDVDIDRVGGGIEVRTTSGDVVLGGARGVGRLETSGGDVQLELRDPEGRFELRTASGDVELHLVPPYAGQLEASTASGTIEVVVPLTVQQANRNRLVGRLGAGVQVLHVSTASGDIHVVEGDRGGEL